MGAQWPPAFYRRRYRPRTLTRRLSPTRRADALFVRESHNATVSLFSCTRQPPAVSARGSDVATRASTLNPNILGLSVRRLPSSPLTAHSYSIVRYGGTIRSQPTL